MGQYFMPILGDSNGLNCKVFDRSVDGEYMLAKLMEHSWWNNPFCNSFAEKLYKTKGRVCWVGDYSDDDDFNFKNSSAFYTPCYGEVWGETVKRHGSISTDFSLSTINSCSITTPKNLSTWTITRQSRLTKTAGLFTLSPCLLLLEMTEAVEIFTKAISALNMSDFGLGS